MKIETQVIIETEDKGHVVVNKCALPSPIAVTVVRLDLPAEGESRYRFRLQDGVEGRVSVAGKPHYQKQKRHKNKSIYVVHNGWIALLVEQPSGYEVNIAFARNGEHFYAEVPGNTWYAAYLSKDTVFTYASADTDTGDVRDYASTPPTEQEILELYGRQEGLHPSEVHELVTQSMPG